jgi:hypothetical protein
MDNSREISLDKVPVTEELQVGQMSKNNDEKYVMKVCLSSERSLPPDGQFEHPEQIDFHAQQD